MSVTFYETLIAHPQSLKYDTQTRVLDLDGFTAAGHEENACCLNFASPRQPGGGYRAVIGTRMPIKTQEEDLFRRSNLPELMDNEKIRLHYPLGPTSGLYCLATVSKDRSLNDVEPFEVGVVTVPAVVSPREGDQKTIEDKIDLILGIAATHGHEAIILGAWGCGVFGNDPENIALTFKKFLTNEYHGVFRNVVFAIPGRESLNHQVFAKVFCHQ